MGTSRSSRRLIKVVFPDPFCPTNPTYVRNDLRLLHKNFHLCVHLNAQVHFAEYRLVSASIAETHLTQYSLRWKCEGDIDWNLTQAQDWALQQITLSKVELDLIVFRILHMYGLVMMLK